MVRIPRGILACRFKPRESSFRYGAWASVESGNLYTVYAERANFSNAWAQDAQKTFKGQRLQDLGRASIQPRTWLLNIGSFLVGTFHQGSCCSQTLNPIWGFPKIGDPNRVPLIVVKIRRQPNFRKVSIGSLGYLVKVFGHGHKLASALSSWTQSNQ